MTDSSVRFLGFAFASADLLFELDGEGKVAFAMGASQRAFGQDVTRLSGRSWRELIAESDHELVSEFIEGLADAGRRGPIKVALALDPGRKLARYGALSACRLPQLKPNISCVLSLTAGLAPSVKPADGPHNLHTRESFFATVDSLIRDSAEAGSELNVQVVKVEGLKAASVKLGEAGARAIMEHISAAVRAKKLPKKRPTALVKEALEAKVITEAEAKVLQAANAAREDAIQVDSFTLDEFEPHLLDVKRSEKAQGGVAKSAYG